MTVNNSDNSSIASPSIPRDPLILQIIIRFVYGIVFIIGSGGNLLVCVAIARKRRLRTISNYFTFNLALSDLIIVIFWLPTQLVSYEIGGFWIFGDFLCNLSYSLVPICLTASIGSLVAISWDRFRAIVFPLRPRLTIGTAKAIIVLIWSVSVITTSPLFFYAGTHEVGEFPGRFYCYDVWPKVVHGHIYWFFVFISQYIVPLFLISLFSVITAQKLRKNSMPLIDKTNSYAATTAALRIRQSAKITKMLAALVILYAICMLPQHIVYFIPVLGGVIEPNTQDLLYKMLNLFPMANSSFNPIAYGTLNKEFKTVFRNFFTCRFYDDERSGTVGGSTGFKGKRLTTFKGTEYSKVKSAHSSKKKNEGTKYGGVSSSSSECSHENSYRIFKGKEQTNSTRALVGDVKAQKSNLKKTNFCVTEEGSEANRTTNVSTSLPQSSLQEKRCSEVDEIFISLPESPVEVLNDLKKCDGSVQKTDFTEVWKERNGSKVEGNCVKETTV